MDEMPSVEELTAEIAAMTAVLEWYAENHRYEVDERSPQGQPSVILDHGKRAQRILKKAGRGKRWYEQYVSAQKMVAGQRDALARLQIERDRFHDGMHLARHELGKSARKVGRLKRRCTEMSAEIGQLESALGGVAAS